MSDHDPPGENGAGNVDNADLVVQGDMPPAVPPDKPPDNAVGKTWARQLSTSVPVLAVDSKHATFVWKKYRDKNYKRVEKPQTIYTLSGEATELLYEGGNPVVIATWMLDNLEAVVRALEKIWNLPHECEASHEGKVWVGGSVKEIAKVVHSGGKWKPDTVFANAMGEGLVAMENKLKYVMPVSECAFLLRIL